MTPSLGFDAATLALAAGGLVGSAMRLLVNKDQPTLSRQSVVDLVTGGLVGIFVPAVYAFPDGWTLAQQAAAVALIAYFCSDLVTHTLRRIVPGALPVPKHRRAEDPPPPAAKPPPSP